MKTRTIIYLAIIIVPLAYSCKKDKKAIITANNAGNSSQENTIVDKRDTLIGIYTGITEANVETIYFWYQAGDWRDSSEFTYYSFNDTIRISKDTGNYIKVTSHGYNISFLDTVKLTDTFNISGKLTAIVFSATHQFTGTDSFSIDRNNKNQFHIRTYAVINSHDIFGGQGRKTTYSSTIHFYKR